MKGNHEKAQATLPVYSVAWALARAFTAKGQVWQSLGNFGWFTVLFRKSSHRKI